MSWYYAENNERRGPIDDAAFETLVSNGTIKPETLVWREGFPEWIAYSQAGSSSAVSSDPAPVAVATSPSSVTTVTAPVSSSAAAACSQCGRLFPADDMVNYEGRYVCADCKPLFFQKIREGASVTGERQYAGFWIRFGAKFIDGILMNIVNRILLMIIGSGIHDPTTAAVIGFFIALATNGAYVIYMTGKYGATLGKMACKIEVIRNDGGPMTFGLATGRFFAEILSALTIYIGYIMAAFDDEKRALHDRICDTRVIKKQPR